jgi:hypothetical protein
MQTVLAVLGVLMSLGVVSLAVRFLLPPILAKLFGNWASYHYAILISPRRWGPFRRDYRPCPKCGGKGSVMSSGGIQYDPCYFCYGESQRGAPVGYVSARYLRDGWDWRENWPKPGYPYNPQPHPDIIAALQQGSTPEGG